MSRRRPSKAIRIHFFGLEGYESAATRAHCERPARLLSARGAEVRIHLPPQGGHGLMFSQRRARRALHLLSRVLPRRVFQTCLASRADLVVVQRAIYRVGGSSLLEQLLASVLWLRGRSLVLNLDDAL